VERVRAPCDLGEANAVETSFHDDVRRVAKDLVPGSRASGRGRFHL